MHLICSCCKVVPPVRAVITHCSLLFVLTGEVVLTSSTSEVKNALLVLLVGILVLLEGSRRLLVRDTCLLVGPSSVTGAAQ